MKKSKYLLPLVRLCLLASYAGTVFTLTDGYGNTVLTKTTKKAGGALILSSPAMVSGKTYTLKSGSTPVGSVTVFSKVSTIGSV